MLLHTKEYATFNVRAVRVAVFHSSQHGLCLRRGGLNGDGEDWGLLETHRQRLSHCVQARVGEGLRLNLHLHMCMVLRYSHSHF